MTIDILTEHERNMSQAVLARESANRQHVVIALSGAHAYGFPSPDSDLDLKAVHIAPTRELLGLRAPTESADVLETHEGVEIDYTSNELGAVVGGMLAGNGNYIERILGALIVQSSPLHETLRPICRAALSRRVCHHYRGFARSQLKVVLAEACPPAKRVLYVLRTALTGTHLLRSGELVVDVRELLDEYGHQGARELIAQKRAGELTRLDEAAKERWLSALERTMAGIEDAYRASCLPEEPANAADAEAWLVQARLDQL